MVWEMSRLVEPGSVHEYHSYTISEDFHGELHACRDADATPDRLLATVCSESEEVFIWL